MLDRRSDPGSWFTGSMERSHHDALGPPPGGVRTTKRRGRLAPGARTALNVLSLRWMLGALPTSTEALDQGFGRQAPRLLDIGCGNGSATRAWAADRPDHDVLAVELHRPGLARLLRDLDHDGPGNVRVVEGDAVALVDGLPSGSFAGIRILFPDPWPKRRHLARRLVDQSFVSRLTDRLLVGGQLHVATDWADYADQARHALDAEDRLAPVVDAAGHPWRSARPDRPVTAYEQRAHDAGRAVTDLVALLRTPSTDGRPFPSPQIVS